jgi:hypothetical protein
MLQEFAKGLLRAALKKAAEQTLRKKDDRLGAVLGIVNALTEKADTRNWQTLPHSIYYSRVPLQEGKNELKLLLHSGRNQDSTAYSFTYQVKKGETLFHTFSSLETVAALILLTVGRHFVRCRPKFVAAITQNGPIDGAVG